MWTIFLKVFIEFVTVLLLFYVLGFWLPDMWEICSPVRDWICTPCVGRWSLNHWTTREVLLSTSHLKRRSCKFLSQKCFLPNTVAIEPFTQPIFIYHLLRQWQPTPVLLPRNPMDRGAAVHGVAKSQTWLSDFTFTFHFHALEKEMATHFRFLPGESQGQGSLVGCRLWGRTELDTHWSDLEAAAAYTSHLSEALGI